MTEKETNGERLGYLSENSSPPVFRPGCSDANVPQPTGIEAAVCRDIAERQQAGIAKYGTTVADNPLNRLQWLHHAYQEALDFAVYLRRLIEIEAGNGE